MNDGLLKVHAQNIVLKRALRLSSQCVADMEDLCEIECLGADTHYSVVIAVAAEQYGLANKGDSAYDFDKMTIEQAKKVVGRYAHGET